MAQFGIRYIAGYSSEARGRFERASEHSGDRLPKVLALAGITTMQNIQAHRNES